MGYNTMLPITFSIYLDAQIALDLAEISTFKLASIFFLTWPQHYLDTSLFLSQQVTRDRKGGKMERRKGRVLTF